MEAGGIEITELGHLGVDESGSTTAEAGAISENGTIVGRAIKYSPEFAYLGDRAVRWDPGQTVATEFGKSREGPLGRNLYHFERDQR